MSQSLKDNNFDKKDSKYLEQVLQLQDKYLANYPEEERSLVAFRLLMNVAKQFDTIPSISPEQLGLNFENSKPQAAVFECLRNNINDLYKLFFYCLITPESGLSTLNTPKLIIAPPKSASSFFSSCAGNMLAMKLGVYKDYFPFGLRNYPSWWKIAKDIGVNQLSDWQLRPEMFATLGGQSYGSIYKGHMEPISSNFAILNTNKLIKYIIYLRDPRDLLIANACQALVAKSSEYDLPANIPLCSVNREIKRKGHDVDDVLSEMITGGYLISLFNYMALWLKSRNVEQSMVVTLEKFNQAPMECLTEVNTVFELGLKNEAIELVYKDTNEFFARESKNRKENKEMYPKGYSGKVGIWESYFTPRHREKFREIVEVFKKAYPWSGELFEYYPLDDI
ncbi:MAG: sulfotransferase domain-containing protein [Magnetococcales bacterium]|nr:sulfotransferase domain-containing protein [Magnetococcales bacterium]